MRVSPDGGTPEVLVGVKEGEEVYGPDLLPGGQHVLFTLATGTARDRWDKARIVVQSITSGESKTLIEGGSDARYVPTGHLVYALSGIVYAVAFDLNDWKSTARVSRCFKASGDPRAGLNGAASFSLSSTGSLAYIPGPVTALFQMTLADRKGGDDLLNLPPGNYFTPRFSPDGKRIAFGIDDGKEAVVYTYELDERSAAATHVWRKQSVSDLVRRQHTRGVSVRSGG